jgi:hypothetical protein
MGEPKFVLTAGAVPYEDGSGDAVTAVVERTDEGVRLKFEVVHNIPVGDWPAVRRMIDNLVKAADALTRRERGDA